jgi:threonine/homoserine efflux transporter RhtA
MAPVAVVVGFAGVLVVIRPGSSVIPVGVGHAGRSAIAYAVYQISYSSRAGLDHPSTSIFYSAFAAPS